MRALRGQGNPTLREISCLKQNKQNERGYLYVKKKLHIKPVAVTDALATAKTGLQRNRWPTKWSFEACYAAADTVGLA